MPLPNSFRIQLPLQYIGNRGLNYYIDARWRTSAGISYKIGRDDEDQQAPAGNLNAQLDDRDGTWSPRNVLGAYYGKLHRNTPFRLIRDAVRDSFTRALASGWGTEEQSRLPWVTGSPSLWSVSGGQGRATLATAGMSTAIAVNQPTGLDVEVKMTLTVNNSTSTSTGSWLVVAQLRRTDANNYLGVRADLRNGRLRWSVVKVIAGVTTVLLAADYGVTPDWSYNFGAVGGVGTLVARVRLLGDTLYMDGYDSIAPSPDTSYLTTTFTLPSIPELPLSGPTFGILHSRLSGSLVTSVGIDQLEVSNALFSGIVPEWPVRWPEKSGTDAVVDFSGSGALRYLSQGAVPLLSPLRQQLAAASLPGVVYLPLEDGVGTVLPAAGLAGGSPGAAIGCSFGNDDAPPGALSAVSLDTALISRVTARVQSWSSLTLGFTVLAFLKLGSLPASGTNIMEVGIDGSPGLGRITVRAAATGFFTVVTAPDGTSVNVTGTTAYNIDPTKWFGLRLRVIANGFNPQWELAWYQVGLTTVNTQGATETGAGGAPGRPSYASLIAPTDAMMATSLWVGGSSATFTDSVSLTIANAFFGETDSARVARVLGNYLTPVKVEPGDGVKLGYQPKAATPLDVARDAEKAGFGTLYETGSSFGYIPASAKFLPPVTVALDWALGHLDEAPEPKDDDLALVNRWTSSRPMGSERSAQNATSINENGVYEDGGEANVATDDQLQDDAGWHVALGTRQGLRWPFIRVNLMAHPELIPVILQARIGSRLTIANLPSQVTGEIADLIIEGIAAELNKFTWTVTFSCVGARPWTQIGIWEQSLGESSTSLVAAPFSKTDTSISVSAKWPEDTWAAPPPGGYYWTIDGEPIQVTVVSAATVGGDSRLYQTATVARGPLAKDHTSGGSVRLYDAFGRWGF